MNNKIKTIAVPLFVALSLILGACADQTTESPDAVDDTVQDGVEGVEQGADDAGNAIEDGVENLEEGVEQGADETGNAIDEGLKNLEKDAKGAADSAQDVFKEGVENTGRTIEDLGQEIPSSEQ